MSDLGELERIDIPGASIEIFRAGSTEDRVIAAAHPAAAFTAATAQLIAGLGHARAVCLNPRGIGGSSAASATCLPQMVDDFEAVRSALGLEPWVFWGMSGGGWLALLYAHRHPEGLAGIVVESACLCFRERLADPACALSPFFPAWRGVLESRQLLDADSHARPTGAEDATWMEIAGVGSVLRRRDGAALMVSPMAIDDGMKRALRTLWTFDARDFAGAIRTPTLVIAGEADPVVPVARARAVAEHIPGSTFASVPSGGHVPSTEASPDLRARIRAFVGACRPPG
jgi:pimeloyl-ACP methyl ester carboxylesterase